MRLPGGRLLKYKLLNLKMLHAINPFVMRKLWSILLILVTLAFASEGLFAAENAHACDQSKISVLHSSSVPSTAGTYQAPQTPENSVGFHVCHIGHCAAMISRNHSSQSQSAPIQTMIAVPDSSYISPVTLGFLRPPSLRII